MKNILNMIKLLLKYLIVNKPPNSTYYNYSKNKKFNEIGFEHIVDPDYDNVSHIKDIYIKKMIIWANDKSICFFIFEL